MTAAKQFGPDRASRMAAAIAYRAVFAIAPLFIVIVGVAGIVVGGSVEVEQRLVEAVDRVGGPEMADLVASFVQPAVGFGGTAAIVGIVLLLWLISSLFLEVQRDLDDIFEVPYEYVAGLPHLAKQRWVGALWSIGLGLGLLVLFFLNGLWRFLEGLFPDDLSGLHNSISIVTPIISMLLLPILFTLVLQTMTSVTLAWRPVWWGSIFISVSFMLALYGVGWYFELFGTPTAIGFASSLVIVLFMAYVLSSVFLFGAEVTKALLDRSTASAEPAPDALVAELPPPVSRAAVLGFLGGLLVGWWKSDR